MAWTPEQRKRHSERMKRAYADPSVRAKATERILKHSFAKGQPAWNAGLRMGPSPKRGIALPADQVARRTETRKANNGGHYHTSGPWTKGWPKSEETRRRIAEANLRRDLSGSRNPAWRGGRSFAPYPPEFNRRLKGQVLREQQHQCADCSALIGRRKGARRANVHHIDGNKHNSDRSNLVGLCVPCHMRREWQVTAAADAAILGGADLEVV